MKNCPYCKTILNDNAVRCHICGYVYQQYYQPQYYQQYPQYSQQYQQPQPQSNYNAAQQQNVQPQQYYQQYQQPQYYQYDQQSQSAADVAQSDANLPVAADNERGNERPLWVKLLAYAAVTLGVIWLLFDAFNGAELADEWLGDTQREQADVQYSDSGVGIVKSDYDMGAVANITVDEFIDKYNKNLQPILETAQLSADDEATAYQYLLLDKDDAIVVEETETPTGLPFVSYIWVGTHAYDGIDVSTDPETGAVRDIIISIDNEMFYDSFVSWLVQTRYAAAYAALTESVPDKQWMVDYISSLKGLMTQSRSAALWRDGYLFSTVSGDTAMMYMITPASDEKRDQLSQTRETFKYFYPLSEYNVLEYDVEPRTSYELLSDDYLYFNYTFEEFLSSYNYFFINEFSGLDTAAQEIGIPEEWMYATYGLLPFDFCELSLTDFDFQNGARDGKKYVYIEMEASMYKKITVYVNSQGYVYNVDFAYMSMEADDSESTLLGAKMQASIAAAMPRMSRERAAELFAVFAAHLDDVNNLPQDSQDYINDLDRLNYAIFNEDNGKRVPIEFLIAADENGLLMMHYIVNPNSTAPSFDELLAQIESEPMYVFDITLDEFESRYRDAMSYYADQTPDIERFDLSSEDIYYLDSCPDWPVRDYYYGSYDDLSGRFDVKISVTTDYADRIISVKVITNWDRREDMSQEECWLSETDDRIRFGKMFENICALALYDSPTQFDIEYIESLHSSAPYDAYIYNDASYSVEYGDTVDDTVDDPELCSRCFTIRAASGFDAIK